MEENNLAVQYYILINSTNSNRNNRENNNNNNSNRNEYIEDILQHPNLLWTEVK